LGLQAAKIGAQARLNMHRQQAEEAVVLKPEEPALPPREAFSQAYHDWLRGKAGIEDP
jgi:hypothetical protein